MLAIGKAQLRIARPTDHMSEIIRFYRDGLGVWGDRLVHLKQLLNILLSAVKKRNKI